MKDLEEVFNKVKDTENSFTNLIIPILKDSNKDGNQHNKRLFVINMMLVLSLVVISVTSMIIITKQNDRYIAFMEQFDFETTEVYQSTNDYSDINSGIKVIK